MYQKLKNFVRIKLEIFLGKSPSFKVQTKLPFIRIGGKDYGFWNINIDHINQNSIVYSFGVGTDISFDLELIAKTNCKVFAFDPTPQSIQFINSQVLPQNFHFQPIGIANYNGTAKFYKPANENYVSHSITTNQNTKNEFVEVEVRTLSEIMTLNGHDFIDVLKMDIEGAEYDIIDDLCILCDKINQLLIEFHHRYFENGKNLTQEFVVKLNKSGFSIFSISNSNEELSFVRDKNFLIVHNN